MITAPSVEFATVGWPDHNLAITQEMLDNLQFAMHRLAYELTIDGKTTRKRIGKRDQFAPEILCFSDCIRKGRDPEPSGAEGLQDVRIVQALYESAQTGKAVAIPPFERSKQPTGRQRIRRPRVRQPDLIKVKSPNQD
jgi:GFO/IDH/MocA oxidoreductase family protein